MTESLTLCKGGCGYDVDHCQCSEKLVERWFVEVLGWFPRCVMPYVEWQSPSGDYMGPLPNILTDFPALKKYVIEPMKERGYSYEIRRTLNQEQFFYWCPNNQGTTWAEIKDDNWLEAAVRAGLKVGR